MVEPVIGSGNSVKQVADMLLLLTYLLRFQFRVQNYYKKMTYASICQ